LKIVPNSLFGRTAVTIALTLSAFLIISTAAIIFFVVRPMAQRSANDFAADIVSAAQSLRNLPVEQHAELKRELLHDYGVVVTEQTPVKTQESPGTPYLRYFYEGLKRHSDEEMAIFASDTGPLIWVQTSAHGKTYRLGFDRGRLGINPPLALIMAICGGAALTFTASLFEVRRVTKHLEHFSSAANDLAHGRSPPSVPEDGPEEIAALAATFNQMSTDLQVMNENRTVMIAGISHDLRTPLTRLELAVEMLDEGSNHELVARIRRNLDTMNKLIDQFLQFSRGIETSNPVQLYLWEVVELLLADLRPEGVEVRLHKCTAPCIYFADRNALERVLMNLLKNAVQYGSSAPIDVDLRCNERGGICEISDRGPGIPEDQVEAVFRPFHRLDNARDMRSGGSGLGLAIARQLAVKHGWKIKLLPREGGGTTARLSLPPIARAIAA
jgi:two-component system osmolarity sensor histidine kinase EnvZ